MSTCNLSPERFANLRASLAHHATDGLSPKSCPCFTGDMARALGVSPFAVTAEQDILARIDAIIFDWRRINNAAWAARYEKSRKTTIPKLPRGTTLSVPATLKALRALRYNCDSGEAVGEALRVSLAVLAELIDTYTEGCLELMPEYRNAEWAI